MRYSERPWILGNVGKVPRGAEGAARAQEVTWQRDSGQKPRVVAICQLSWNYFKILAVSVVNMVSTGIHVLRSMYFQKWNC